MHLAKKILPISILVVVVFGFVFIVIFSFSGDTINTSESSSNNNERPKVSGELTDLVIGDSSAGVTIEEFSDYKCFNCGEFHRSASQQINKEYVESGKAKIVFRAFPVKAPDSGRALKGAYCANDQQKFEPYHNAVFKYMWDNYYYNGRSKAEIEDILTIQVLGDIAQEEGIDEKLFNDCLVNDRLNYNIDNDIIRAADAGVQGTPTLIVNGQKIVGSKPYNTYKALLDIQLQ